MFARLPAVSTPRPIGPDPGPRWWNVEREVTASELEVVADRLWAHGAVAISETPDPEIPDRVRLVAGFDDAGAAGRAADAVTGRMVAVDDDTWLDAWRAFARPVRVADRLVVRPAWVEPADDDAAAVAAGTALDVVVEPGRCFGDGAHPTTRQVLAWLVEAVRPGCRMADVGCGSGVLAVAALVLGAGSAVALDVDADAVAVTRANAEANGVADRCTVHLVGGDPRELAGHLTGGVDVIAANIGANALVAAADVVVAALAPGGVLALSGVLTGRAGDVIAAYGRAGLVVAVERVDEDWALLVGQR
jgi:ribosomal protein L11 methyltransferase